MKATTELHERLENRVMIPATVRARQSLGGRHTNCHPDAVFSLEAVISAVGMVAHLPVMMAAVVIALAVMLLASKPLTRFVNQLPTVVVLCLSFLLIIGLSLVAEGFGFHIPKGYLYAAIRFRSSSKCLTRLRVATLFVSSRACGAASAYCRCDFRLMGGKRQANVGATADNPCRCPIREVPLPKKNVT
ncbi:TerC family protein [Shigella sonnei]